MKTCSKCNEEKDLECFSRDSKSKNGRTYVCKSCKAVSDRIRRTEKKDEIREAKKEYYNKNKDKLSDYGKEYRVGKEDKIKEYNKEYYNQNKDKLIEYQKRYTENNKKKVDDRRKKYKENNKVKLNNRKRHYTAKRRAAKLNATPSWAELDKIKVVYQKASQLSELLGCDMEVDHYIPLNNPNVCGLHVWSNLQILEKEPNREKSNKLLHKEY
jgi:hypothetical protein